MATSSLWVGDSFTAGEGSGAPPWLTYPYLVSERFGWECHVDAQNGTGFVNDGFLAGPGLAPLAGRLADVARRCPADIVLVDGGRNDVEASPDRLRQAVAGYLARVRAAYPEARLVLVLPSLLGRFQPPEYTRIGDLLRAIAGDWRADVIDPAGEPGFAQAAVGVDLVCADGFHPSAAGQAHYADVLTVLLRRVGLS